MAGRSDGSVIIDTRMDAGGFGRGVANMKKGFDGIGTALGRIAKLMVGVFAVRQLVNFGKEAIELGSDLSEVQNVVDVTFGDLSEEVNRFASNAITQFGLSETAAKQYTSTMGAMLKSMGFTERAAADMGMAMTGLAADMASFYNLSAEEAFYKIRSGISGETEPLKQLGINLSVANLEQYALTQGITKSYKAMTQQEQAMLRYNYLLSVTSDAQGDFSRTSASWANQTRVLSEQFNSLKATIGQGLINLFTPVLQVINQLIARLATLANAFKAFTVLITGGNQDSAASGYNSAAAGAENLAASTEDAAQATEDAEKAAKGYLSPLDEISKFSDDSSGSSDGLGFAGGSISGESVDYGELEKLDNTVADELTKKLENLRDIFAKLLKPFKDAWESDGAPTIGAIQGAFDNIKELAQSVGGSMASVWTNGTGSETLSHILGIVQGIVDTVGNIAGKFAEAWNTAGLGTSIVQGIWNIINIILGTIEKIKGSTAEWAANLDFTPLLTSIDGLLRALQPLAQNIGDGLLWFYENVLLPLAGYTIENLIPAFLDVLSSAIGVLNGVIEACKPLFQWLWDNFLQPLAEWTGGVITSVLGIISDLLDRLSDWISKHQEEVQALASTLAIVGIAFFALATPIGAIITVISAAVAAGKLLRESWNLIKGKAKELADNIKEKWESIKESTKNAWDNVKTSISTTWENIKSNVSSAVETAKTTISNAWNNLKTNTSTAWGGIKQTISGTWESIKNNTSSTAANIKNTLSTAWSNVRTNTSTAWNNIKSTISNTINNIRSAASTGSTNIKNAISSGWTNIKNLTSTSWSNIKSTISTTLDNILTKAKTIAGNMADRFSDAFSDIKDGAKRAFESVKDKLSSIWDRVTSAVSSITSKLSEVSGISTYSMGTPIAPVPAAPTPKIPYLASGAVIPPRAAFLAVLGDQRNGNNLEMPESLLRKVVREESGSRGFSGTIRIPLYINGRQVMEAVLEEAQLKQMISGRNPFEMA